MRARAADFQNGKPFQEIGEIASKSIKMNVEAGGRPKWRPRKGVYHHPILDKTGLMRDKAELSALQDWIHSGRTHIKKIIGPLYGLVHQYKGVGKKGKKIVRKYVLFQTEEIKAMGATFAKAFHRK